MTSVVSFSILRPFRELMIYEPKGRGRRRRRRRGGDALLTRAARRRDLCERRAPAQRSSRWPRERLDVVRRGRRIVRERRRRRRVASLYCTGAAGRVALFRSWRCRISLPGGPPRRVLGLVPGAGVRSWRRCVRFCLMAFVVMNDVGFTAFGTGVAVQVVFGFGL